MTQRIWEISEPGVLALLGTDFRIIYSPDDHPSLRFNFLVMQGDCPVQRFPDLDWAKRSAERRQSELEEIGVVPELDAASSKIKQ